MKKNKALIVVRVFIALAAWFLIYKGYEAFIDPMLEGKLPEIVRMIINSMVIPYTVGLGACFLVLRGMEVTERKSEVAVTPGVMAKAFLVQTGLSMPVILISNIILTILGVAPRGMTADVIYGKYFIFYIILLLGYAPVVEEILFRKLFLDRLLVIGETGAIIVSAILFGLPHVYSQGISQMFGTFLIGLVWAYVRVKTGKLWPGIILHIMFNLYGCYFASFMTGKPITAMGFMFMSIILIPVVAVIILVKYFGTRETTNNSVNEGLS